MVGRFAGACLGLLAFALTILTGLVAHNPPMVTLSRALWALGIFCVLGLVLGGIAQTVISEHVRRREEVVLGSKSPNRSEHAGAEAEQVADGDDGAELPTAHSVGSEAGAA